MRGLNHSVELVYIFSKQMVLGLLNVPEAFVDIFNFIKNIY